MTTQHRVDSNDFGDADAVDVGYLFQIQYQLSTPRADEVGHVILQRAKPFHDQRAGYIEHRHVVDATLIEWHEWSPRPSVGTVDYRVRR